MKRSRPQQLTLCLSLHVEALQATVSKGLAQGSYMAVRAGFEPMSLRKDIIFASAPPCPLQGSTKSWALGIREWLC